MKKIMRKLKRSNFLARYSYYLFLILYSISLGFFIKSILALKGIETLIRIVLIVIFAFWLMFYAFYNLLNLITKKYKHYIISTLINILLILLNYLEKHIYFY